MIIMLGSAGAGKSVQSQLISQSLDYQWVSMGMLLRAHSDENLKSELNKGVLITDEVVEQVLGRAIASYADPNKVILDGFPRKGTQASWLADWVTKHSITIEAVIHLVASSEVARKRLAVRNRADDTEEAIALRFAQYEENTKAIIEAFKERQIPVVTVDADQSIDEVNQVVMTGLKPYLVA